MLPRCLEMVIGPSMEFLELKSTLYPWTRAWFCERHSGPSTEKHLSTYAYEPSLCSKEMSLGCTPHQTQDPVALDKQRVGRPYSLYCLDCSTWARLCPYLTPTKIVIVPNHCMRRRRREGEEEMGRLVMPCPVLQWLQGEGTIWSLQFSVKTIWNLWVSA